MSTRIEVKYREGIDSRGKVVQNKIRQLMEEGAVPRSDLREVGVVDAYTIEKELSPEQLAKVAAMLTNPVTQESVIGGNFGTSDEDCVDYAIQIGFKPGVTDNIGTTVRKGIEAKLGQPFADGESVHHTQVLHFGGEMGETAVESMGLALANPLIENIGVMRGDDFRKNGLEPYVPRVSLETVDTIYVPIASMPLEELKLIAKKGIIDPKTGRHRGPLALDGNDAAPMLVIRDHFKGLGRDPTDAELEVLAQTWSEHCKHKIFSAALRIGYTDAELVTQAQTLSEHCQQDTPPAVACISDGYIESEGRRRLGGDVLDGLFSTYIKGATERVREHWKNQGRHDFLRSVFSDNAGVIEFDGDWDFALKVETHNSPSALDPFGGSITGIVGVNRDPLGTGMGCMPVLNLWDFLTGDPRVHRALFKDKDEEGNLSQRMLSNRSILDGVTRGVGDGGNKSGIPTVIGSLFTDEAFSGKPLIYVGTGGIIPRTINGKDSYEKAAMPGDLIVMLGGKVGLDGIHGATFSSETMDSGSPASAVQIGDPITQKKLSDALVHEARDLGLYSSITDNGAGGLSCSVYEMARECNGATIELERVPVKYPGLRPDEILISESQERMTLAVPPDKWPAFKAVMDKHDVEATVIGEFNGSGRAVATFNGAKVVDIDLGFLHDGLPQMKMDMTFTPSLYEHEEPDLDEQEDLTNDLLSMLRRLNICSKRHINEQYDHEVKGGSVIKPMVGRGKVDSPAAVTRPVLDSMRGIVISQGFNPRYSLIDTYQMAACAIDTAIRRAVAAGGKLDSMALLDNFCWHSSDDPEMLGQLKLAAQACYDVAVAWGIPFISGKDSMFNSFKGYDGDGRPVKIDVLPTLMITAVSVMPDVRKAQTLDSKVAGDLVYVIGTTRDETGGSEYLAMKGEQELGRNRKYIGNKVPKVDAELSTANMEAYRMMETAIEQGLVASCFGVDGDGLGVALAKVAIAGQLGMDVDIDNLYQDGAVEGVNRNDSLLFSGSQGRFVVTVDPAKVDEFEKVLEGAAISCIGMVTDDRRFRIRDCTDEIVSAGLEELTESYHAPLRGY